MTQLFVSRIARYLANEISAELLVGKSNIVFTSGGFMSEDFGKVAGQYLGQHLAKVQDRETPEQTHQPGSKAALHHASVKQNVEVKGKDGRDHETEDARYSLTVGDMSKDNY